MKKIPLVLALLAFPLFVGCSNLTPAQVQSISNTTDSSAHLAYNGAALTASMLYAEGKITPADWTNNVAPAFAQAATAIQVLDTANANINASGGTVDVTTLMNTAMAAMVPIDQLLISLQTKSTATTPQGPPPTALPTLPPIPTTQPVAAAPTTQTSGTP